MKGEVRKFRVSTEAAPLCWDVACEVGIALQIDRPEACSPSLLGIYSGRNVERTFVTPGAKIVSDVLVKSLADVMKAMSADPDLIDALKRGQAGRDAKGP